MHTIVAADCTGCELLLLALPGRMHPHGTGRRETSTLEMEIPGGSKSSTAALKDRLMRKLFSSMAASSRRPTRRSRHLPIAQCAPASRLVVPLHQSIGGTRAAGRAGDRVLKGPAHRRVPTAAFPRPSMPRPRAPSVEVAMHDAPSVRPQHPVRRHRGPDGGTNGSPARGVDYRRTARPGSATSCAMPAWSASAAPFSTPSHARQTGRWKTLVINGAECEPFITCDDLLMRERADGIVRGIGAFRDMLHAEEVLIGIGDNKPGPSPPCRPPSAASGERRFAGPSSPTLYPAGGASS